MNPYWNKTAQKELEKRLEELVPVWTEETMLASRFKAQVIGLWCIQKDLQPVVEAVSAKYSEYKRSYSVGGVRVVSVMSRITLTQEIREKYGSDVDTYVTCAIAVNRRG